MGTILVIDDEQDIRESLRDLFGSRGHKTLLAAHGGEALAILRTSVPAVIIMDVQMPVVDGWEFRKAQLGDPSIAKIPTFIFCAGPRPPGLSADGYIRKPVDMADILRIVGPFLNPSSSP